MKNGKLKNQKSTGKTQKKFEINKYKKNKYKYRYNYNKIYNKKNYNIRKSIMKNTKI